MQTITKEICAVRNAQSVTLIKSGKNRYGVAVKEEEGQAVYYFGAPVYTKDMELVDLRFCESEAGLLYNGSSSVTAVRSGELHLASKEGQINVSLEGKEEFRQENGRITSKSAAVYSTLNGFALSLKCERGQQGRIYITTSNNFKRTRSNNKSLAFMKDNFTPFAVISAIGAKIKDTNQYVPVLLTFQRTGEYKHIIFATPASHCDCEIMLEINMYEKKLFQDTTVESGSPKVNNAFGTTAYIGTTDAFGIQWLYSRIDYSKIPEIKNFYIKSMKLYIPQLGKGGSIAAFALDRRFCSFGSTWRNKLAFGRAIETDASSFYQVVDLTALMTEKETHALKKTEGILIKPPSNTGGYAPIFTGDSSFMPQILEVKYRL